MPVSNADRIRAMTDEELAQYLAHVANKQTNDTDYFNWELRFFRGWLKREADK
jgi:hypothetical protein